MPDDQDYAALAELLAEPSLWTSEQQAFVLELRESQQRTVDDAHPLDAAGRDRLRGVVAELDRAIARREESAR
ncbi:hypothetical protein [Aeromicrobium sp.]|uniref:hypothetical protein n=1 Tax=Aeromicrobium sp. TaxID=1871063 RepID=UPI002FCAC79A